MFVPNLFRGPGRTLPLRFQDPRGSRNNDLGVLEMIVEESQNQT
jgi:hypothetical protein